MSVAWSLQCAGAMVLPPPAVPDPSYSQSKYGSRVWHVPSLQSARAQAQKPRMMATSSGLNIRHNEQLQSVHACRITKNLPLVQTVSLELWKYCYIFLVTSSWELRAKHVKIDKHVVVSAEASVRVSLILTFNAVGRCTRETSLKETGSALINN